MATSPLRAPDPNNARQLAEAWLIDRQGQGRTQHTITYYRQQIGAFVEYMEANGIDVSALTRHQIRAYFQRLRLAGATPSKMYASGRIVSAFLHWCESEGLIEEDALLKVKWPRAPRTLIQPFTMRQLQSLLEAAETTTFPERDVAMLLVMLDTACRASELCNLRDDDIQEDRVKIFGKGSKWRMGPISPRTLEAIRKWQAVRGPSPWLFTTRLLEQYEYKNLDMLFKRLSIKAEIDGVRCSPHTMRHTAAVEWLRAGGDPISLQHFLGHADFETTRRYVLMNHEDVFRVHHQVSLVRRLHGDATQPNAAWPPQEPPPINAPYPVHQGADQQDEPQPARPVRSAPARPSRTRLPMPPEYPAVGRGSSPVDGAQVREARLVLGMTQYALAAELGMSESYLSRLECGEVKAGPACGFRLRCWLAKVGQKGGPQALPGAVKTERSIM